MDGHVKVPRWLLICLGLAAVAFLIYRRDGFGSIGPYAVFLLCPLMHLLMMGHMGHGHDHKDEAGSDPAGSCHGTGAERKETAEEESA